MEPLRPQRKTLCLPLAQASVPTVSLQKNGVSVSVLFSIRSLSLAFCLVSVVRLLF
jgi:hypothetical protein